MTERRGPVIKKLRGTAGPPVCRFYHGHRVERGNHLRSFVHGAIKLRGITIFRFARCLIQRKLLLFLYIFLGEKFLIDPLDRSNRIGFFFSLRMLNFCYYYSYYLLILYIFELLPFKVNLNIFVLNYII